MSVEEIKVHNLSKKKPAKKAKLPHSHGRMMDFAPRRRAVRPQPQRPSTIVVTEVEEVVEVASKPAPEPVVSSHESEPPMVVPQAKTSLGAHVGLMSEAKPMPKPEPKPESVTPEPIARSASISTAEANQTLAGIAPIVPPDFYEEKDDDLEEPELTPEAVEEVAPVGYRPIPSSQDSASPFLSSVNVEKRPLSSHPIAEPIEYPRYTKNVYEDDETMLEEHQVHHQSKQHKTKIVPTKKKKKSKIPMILLITATALLGVALGILVYFAIFRQ